MFPFGTPREPARIESVPGGFFVSCRALLSLFDCPALRGAFSCRPKKKRPGGRWVSKQLADTGGRGEIRSAVHQRPSLAEVPRNLCADMRLYLCGDSRPQDDQGHPGERHKAVAGTCEESHSPPPVRLDDQERGA